MVSAIAILLRKRKDHKKFVLASDFVACYHTLNYLVRIPTEIIILVFLPTNCPALLTDYKRALTELWWSDILPSFNCLLKIPTAKSVGWSM